MNKICMLEICNFSFVRNYLNIKVVSWIRLRYASLSFKVNDTKRKTKAVSKSKVVSSGRVSTIRTGKKKEKNR